MKSQGFLQTPQDIMEEYNGCSVPQYTRYRCYGWVYKGEFFVFTRFTKDLFFLIFNSGEFFIH